MEKKYNLENVIKLKTSSICNRSGIYNQSVIKYLYESIIDAVMAEKSFDVIREKLMDNGIKDQVLIDELMPLITSYSKIIEPEVIKRKQKYVTYINNANSKAEENSVSLKTYFILIIVVVFYFWYFSQLDFKEHFVFVSIFSTALGIYIVIKKFFKNK